ncbi:TetR/AcrR family transcriptional regulator [Salinifilum aidingensis]
MAEKKSGPQRRRSAEKASEPAKAEPAVHQAPARPGAVLQRRGVVRVQAILNAAEEILAEEGYEAATLKAISERTGIPIASVYHYFADRHQVDAELISRHVEVLTERMNAVDGIEGLRSLDEAAAVVLDPLVEYFRAHPSCTELWFSGRGEAVASIVAQFDESTAEFLWRLAIERGLLVESAPLLVMRVAFEAGGALFDMAFKQDPKGDDAIVAEAKRLVTAYLQTYAPSDVD